MTHQAGLPGRPLDCMDGNELAAQGRCGKERSVDWRSIDVIVEFKAVGLTIPKSRPMHAKECRELRKAREGTVFETFVPEGHYGARLFPSSDWTARRRLPCKPTTGGCGRRWCIAI